MTALNPSPEIVSVVYFSGTGGTRRIAETFTTSLTRRGYRANCIALDASPAAEHSPDERALFGRSSSVILIFAVHAFDAPEPVYRWLETAAGESKRTAVISVSGGGEIWPNTGCRAEVIDALTHRGFDVTYEKMMVMPSNWVMPVGDEVSMHLLRAAPEKTELILDRFLNGYRRRTDHRLSWSRRHIRTLEKRAAHQFPTKIHITDQCNGCGWCVRHCPTNNINCVGQRPEFGENCVMCFRCVYGCPLEAMQAKDFQVLKVGFDLRAVERRMAGKALPRIDECCTGIVWSGVRRYLNDEDGY